MKSFPFTVQDVLTLKWKILAFVVSLFFCIVIFFIADIAETDADQSLAIARRDFQTARQSVDDIAQEEATIIEYIDRFNELSAVGAMDTEDRIQFLERVSGIWEANDLFPIALDVAEQHSMSLNYPIDEPEPGAPIELLSSKISLSLPLLHEEDLTRLLSEITSSKELFQIQACSISKNNRDYENYFYLAQHFTAHCEIMWYTFNLDVQPEMTN